MATTVTKILTNNNILSGSSSQLVTTKDMIRNFGAEEDYVELHVSDPSGKHIYSVVPFLNYKVPGVYPPTDTYSIQDLEFDPASDLKNLGLSFGDYIATYNILRPKIVKNYNFPFFIKEISGDRTEIRLSTNNVTNDVIELNTLEFINEFQNQPYFKEFYINFGQNKLIPSINIALDTNTNPYSILIKLLSPLPIQYKVNTLVSIIDEISNPQIFETNITLETTTPTYPSLRGPNFDLELDNLRVGPTPYYNFTEVTNFTGQFNPQLQQLLGQLSASNFSINIDYTNYEDFIHYSSAARRLEGFQYKLENIELYTSQSSSAAASSNPISLLDAQKYQSDINKTIQSFDGYEKYLYFESSSFSWPKSNSTKPYVNYSVTSSNAINWFNTQFEDASLYDDNNQNYLLYTLPGYINENDDNELVFKFVASIGQMFDDIWIHIKAITDLYQSKNALNQGISKDLVYFALQSLGVDTYTDNDGNNVFQYLYGVDSNGNYLPASSSYETLITASQFQISGQDQQKGIYKRLYHNLPLLLKSKGTNRFIQYLNTIFGIPSTVMGYVEYGGIDKSTSTTEYDFDRFTYGLDFDSNSYISIPWPYLSQSYDRTGIDLTPNGIEFRFKASPSFDPLTPQPLLILDSGVNLSLHYSSIGSSDSIYSGSSGEFGYLLCTQGTDILQTPTIPIFTTGSNGENSWYSVLLQKRYPSQSKITLPQYYDLYVKNNVYGEIGHIASASMTVVNSINNNWYNTGSLTVGNDSLVGFTGSMQEIRFWSNYLSESAFDYHVLNPESIEGNTTSSAFTELATRFTLGNNLYTYNHFLTGSVYSTHPDQKTQILEAGFTFPNKNNYSSFTETYYTNVANSGYANPVTDKIRIYSGSEYGTQLMPNKSIELQPLLPTTKDIHLIDASLSPQDEIDRDIIANLGSLYNVDEFIGDPSGASYDGLDDLREEYFKKYINKYNYKDFINLIEYFHNSLFRTLKDFTPARTNAATGIVIKPHLLERSVDLIQDPSASMDNNFSQSIDTLFITASSGANYNQPTYSYTVNGDLGPVTLISDARDFFTGELPSASIFIHDDFDLLNENPYINFQPDTTSSYSESIWNVEFNPLLNNSELNQTSINRKKKIIVVGNADGVSGSVYVTESFQYQDFTDNYHRHSYPRYEGSTTTSQTYNIFSVGDSTFGKTSVIDKNTRVFSFFSEAEATGSDMLSMPERTNLYIKYLIDETGSLTELTKRNYSILTEDQKYNLYQVQNIFKSGESVNVGLFDNQNPTRQQQLDGNKKIFAGGFKFYPILWSRSSTPTNFTYELVSPRLLTVTTITGGDGGYDPMDFLATFDDPEYNSYLSRWTTRITITSNYYVSNNINVQGTVTFLDNITYGFLVPLSIGQWANSVILTLPDFSDSYSPPTLDAFSITSVTLQSGGTGTGTGGTSTYSTYSSSSIDPQPYLKVYASQSNVLIASPIMSQYYPGTVSGSYTSEGFYFTGNDGVYSPIYEEAKYPFQISPGDLIRLYNTGSSGAGFSVLEEYEISEIFLPTLTYPTLSFSLNRNINLGTVYSWSSNTGSITQYIISRRIPDETNIIVDFQKREGQTSAGIVKNTNLAQDVDANLANIVSDLKNKIFSTVLIP